MRVKCALFKFKISYIVEWTTFIVNFRKIEQDTIFNTSNLSMFTFTIDALNVGMSFDHTALVWLLLGASKLYSKLEKWLFSLLWHSCSRHYTKPPMPLAGSYNSIKLAWSTWWVEQWHSIINWLVRYACTRIMLGRTNIGRPMIQLDTYDHKIQTLCKQSWAQMIY